MSDKMRIKNSGKIIGFYEQSVIFPEGRYE